MFQSKSSASGGFSEHLDTMSVAATDAVSIVTNFSTGFKADFEWLFLPHSSDLTDQAWKEKEDEILDCLRGANDTVDLWKLRELALTKGGLLTPDLRKRAWLKLTACHEQVLGYHSNISSIGGNASGNGRPMVDASRSDMNALKRDVAKTVWNVEEHLVASRKEQKIQQEKLQQFLELQKQRGRKHVHFAPTTQVASTSPHEDQSKNHRPETVATSPDSEEGQDEFKEQDDHNIMDTSVLSCGDNGTFSPGNSVLTQETSSFIVSSRVVRWRKASKQEQKILFNVITAVLRTEAAPSPHFEDDRYHYFAGLQDLTALLLINLESPSLTSMVLTKLASSHLRDSMRNDRVIVDTAISVCFMPLLESVDSGLYDHLQSAGLTMPTFCRPWITCWFAQDLPNVQLASRVMDVLLVSHPLMPVYLAIAMLTANRSRIFNATHQMSALYTIMRNLPMQCLTDNDGDAMLRIEETVQAAISCMKRVPPISLLVMAKNRLDCEQVKALLPAIAMFQEPPAWTTSAQVPSDWALLQQAKALRVKNSRIHKLNAGEMEEPELDETEVEESEIPVINPEDYPLAMAAAGLSPSSSSDKRFSVMLGLLFVLAIGILTSSSTFAGVTGSTGKTLNVFHNLFRPSARKQSQNTPKLFLPFGRHHKTQKRLQKSTKAPAIVSDSSAPETSFFFSQPVESTSTAEQNASVGFYIMEQYYSLGAFVSEQNVHVLSFFRLQLRKLRSVWQTLFASNQRALTK